jgi:hypothetical protein
MADINLMNPGIQADIDAMAQATRDMDTAIDDFVQIANANLNLIEGDTRVQVEAKLKWLSTTSSTMATNFGDGTKILSSMIDAINHGDKQGANHMNG